MNKVRQANLLQLRHSVFDIDQIAFAKTLNMAQSKLSLLERGKYPIGDESARSIEKSYKLPVGWMDRDNSDFFLSAEEFELVKNIRELTLEQQRTAIRLFDDIMKLVSAKA